LVSALGAATATRTASSRISPDHPAKKASSFRHIRTTIPEVPKADAKVLADTVAQLSWRDLLYPDAWKAAEKSIRDDAWLWRRKPSIDEIAALRIR